MLPAYRATRVLIEVTLEGLPQSVLQAYIFLRVRGYIHVPGWDIGERLEPVPLNALVLSLVLSLIGFVKSWVQAWASAAAVGLPLREYLRQQLQMGAGLPIAAINREAIAEWTAPFPLNNDQARQLSAALVENRSVKSLVIDGCDLPVQQLRGQEPEASHDFTNARLSVPAALIAMRLVERNSIITRLVLSKNPLTRNGRDFEAIDALARALRHHKTLRSLHLADTTLCGIRYGQGAYAAAGVEALARVLSDNRRLRCLSIIGNSISDASLRLIKAALEQRSVALGASRAQLSLCGLEDEQTEADFYQFGLSSTDAMLLASELAQISDGRTSSDNVFALCHGGGGFCCSAASAASELALSSSEVGSYEAPRPLKHHKSETPFRPPSVTALNLLRNPDISVEAARALVDVYADRPQLKTLCGFREGQAAANFYDHKLRPVDGLLLAADLKFNTTLLELNLMSNGLGPLGASALAAALECNMQLTSLDLSDNNLAENGADLSGVETLAAALTTNWVLTRVDLRYNQGLRTAEKVLTAAKTKRTKMASAKPLELLL